MAVVFEGRRAAHESQRWNELRKRYGVDGDGETVVTCNGKLLRAARSLRLRRHSPDGFEWGYGGSGPAQLALALLLEYFDHVGQPAGTDWALNLYQTFKFRVVGRLAHDAWILSGAQIGGAVADIIADSSEQEREAWAAGGPPP